MKIVANIPESHNGGIIFETPTKVFNFHKSISQTYCSNNNIRCNCVNPIDKKIYVNFCTLLGISRIIKENFVTFQLLLNHNKTAYKILYCACTLTSILTEWLSDPNCFD